MNVEHKRTVFILSVSSDIGMNLMDKYLSEGANVIGTYRNKQFFQNFKKNPNVKLLEVDLENSNHLHRASNYFSENNINWDLMILSNGTMEPIGSFMDLDDDKWETSIISNAIMPCRILKSLYPYRSKNHIPSVCFFAGGGTNGTFTNYSSYCLSKIFLIKMCELLDDEVSDLKTFILGPGYTKTKIHNETINANNKAGLNLEKTLNFFDTEGTSMDDIYNSIEWCVKNSKKSIGGRNFSIVHDNWKDNTDDLINRLENDNNLYKLRRLGN